jgi:hypothetical protein
MAKANKTEPHIVDQEKNIEFKSDADPAVPQEHVEQLDKEEVEFRTMRRDLPGVKGSSAIGIVAIGVSKIPGRNEFFRTHREFTPVMPIVNTEVGMETQFFAVTPDMVENLAGIGITVTNHRLYLTVTSRGALRVIPVRQADIDGNQNEYNRTKEVGLVDGMAKWVRLYTDQENKNYMVFPAPPGRFPPEVQWPELKPSKVFRLAFRDKGRLIDSVQHPLFLKWSARDAE